MNCFMLNRIKSAYRVVESHRPSGPAGDKENVPPPVIKEEICPHKSDKYGAISLLDDDQEEEKWSERASVITALDHQVSRASGNRAEMRCYYRLIYP